MRVIQLCAILAVTAALLPAQEETPDKRLRHAADTMQEIMATPDKAIPRDLLNKAECIGIVPNMKKAAFIVGGEYGRGFAMCRTSQGRWSAPAPIKLAGGSFGAQIGGDSADIVFLAMNDRGMQHLLSDKFKFGADAAAVAGPVGRDATASTDATLHAEILSWSRSRGLFAGLALNGTSVEHDSDETEKLYGHPMSGREIVDGRTHTPEAARPLVQEMDTISPTRERSN